jgi:ATP/maltotriose-dependent transcriptional regulator MalT
MLDRRMTPRLLAATKFSVPQLPSRYVPRQRLHAALDAAAQLPLTVVVGVPGAGKSVMLSSWLHDRPELQSIWLSCDARDADPATFWLALGAALTRAWPDRWLDVVDLLAESEPDLDDVAIAIVNDLADLREPVVHESPRHRSRVSLPSSRKGRARPCHPSFPYTPASFPP